MSAAPTTPVEFRALDLRAIRQGDSIVIAVETDVPQHPLHIRCSCSDALLFSGRLETAFQQPATPTRLAPITAVSEL